MYHEEVASNLQQIQNEYVAGEVGHLADKHPGSQSEHCSNYMRPLQLVMEEKRFATVMWGGFDFIADAGGSDPDRQEWLMECSGLQASSSNTNTICCLS